MKILVWSKTEEKKVILEALAPDPIEAGFGLIKDWKKSATEIMRGVREEEALF